MQNAYIVFMCECRLQLRRVGRVYDITTNNLHMITMGNENMWRIIVLSMIPGIILIVQNSFHLHTSANLLRERYHMKENVHISLNIGEVVHKLQNERDIMSLYVSVEGSTEVEKLLQESYTHTDQALDRLRYWAPQASPKKFIRKESFIESLLDFRNKTEDVTYKEVTKQYEDDNRVFINWMVERLKEEKNSDLWKEMVAFHMLVNGKECIGIELSLGAYFFTHGGLDMESLLWYKANFDLGVTFMRMCESYSAVASDIKLTHIDVALERQVTKMQEKILQNTSEIYSIEESVLWVDNMTSYIDQLNDVTHAMAEYITLRTDEEILKYKLDVIVDITVLAVTFIVAILVSLIIYKISKNIQRVKECLQEKTFHLEKEQKRTETLLSQLVPAKIAKRMRSNIVEPEYVRSVTVMFADICNFDTFINRSTPEELLELVNDVFDVFEKSLEKHSVSKLGTTGHTLMLASGLHQKHTKSHTEQIASLALDLLERVQQIHVKQAFGERVKLKIGICTGPVTAGVINGKLPRYCLFGDTVKEAQLMLDTCLPLQIQMTESSYLELSAHKEYILKERDDIPNKNGTIQKKTYWLCGNLNNTLMQIDLDVNNSDT